MKTRWLKIATLSLSILLLISCGGSGSSDDSDKQNGSAPDISDPIDGNNEGENNEGENNEGENNEGENNVDNPPYEGEVLVHNFTLSEKRALLDAHNEYRAKCANGEAGLNSPVNAANMVKVSWDPALEEMARERAQACWFGHFGGPEAIRNAYNSVRHLTSFNSEGLAATKYASENVALYPGNPPATNYGSDTWVAAVREWYLESGSYDWDTNGCHGEYCGHLGQVCEANTRYIGCAVANCPSIGGRDSSDYNDGALQLVCTYWPARDIGQLPFENGYGYPWCTGCAQKDMNQCFNNMCVGGKSTEYEANGGTNDDIDQCTDGLGREEPLCRKNDDSTPPTPVTEFNSQKVGNHLHLSWSGSTDDHQLIQYHISRSPEFEGTDHFSRWSKKYVLSTSEFIDKNPPTSGTVEYTITPYDLAENQGVSKTFSITLN